MVLDDKDIVRRILREKDDSIKITMLHMPTGVKVQGETQASRTKLIGDLLKKLEKDVNNKLNVAPK